MKLAEALARRAELTQRFQELRGRAVASARHQEGDQPDEDPGELLAEAERVAAELEELMARINATNLATEVEPGLTVTRALARRDVLRLRRDLRVDLADAGSVGQGGRFGRSEIKSVSSVDVRALRHDADALAAELRALDSRLQATNWTTEVVDG
ncbi:conserved hypothetical protein [Beutenbergia cavernae DSM 12333]|uniref:Septicolysin n=1 Tax=Beutenbergia cavernae (strain ATCC BAA-8 / DSM 12333 / CCUG 43141 / JCM 11478 / NBRC 16432 / NCIMB 13614 / HKI 0122) TaxID=471853 RepID=C5BY33_BEUC1|nr:DIP1984 family protein [Beutenbergia cavernae]ACQ78927.1 conserved hypothetical protein [Beutenbergia cavernae DSM 12333]